MIGIEGTRQWLAAVGVIGLLAGSCSGAPAAPTSSPTIRPTVVVSPSPLLTPAATAAPPSATPTASPADATASPSGAIPVVMTDAAGTDAPLLFYAPASITAPAGTVVFELRNGTGAFLRHNMSIGTEVGGEALATSATVAPDESSPFAVDDMAPGTYKFWCTVEDHYKFGMVGTLTITP